MRTLPAREKIVGWYHTGPKLHQNDVAINELIRRYCPNSVLVIIDAKPKDLGLPTEAYKAVEEVHDVSDMCIKENFNFVREGTVIYVTLLSILGWFSNFKNV